MQVSETNASLMPDSSANDDVLLSLKDIRKVFGGVEALRGASLHITKGQITTSIR